MRRTASLLVLGLFVAGCSVATSKPSAQTSPAPSSRSTPEGAMWRPGDPEAMRRAGIKKPEGFVAYYVKVAARDSRFAPAAISLSLSEQIELINHDSLLHNITIPASGISVDVGPGGGIYTRPISLAPGRYAFFCNIHGDAGMRGVLTMTTDRDVITLRRGY